METTEAVPVPLVDSTTGLTINRRTHMVEPTSPAAVHADDAARSASLADNSSDSEKMEEDGRLGLCTRCHISGKEEASLQMTRGLRGPSTLWCRCSKAVGKRKS